MKNHPTQPGLEGFYRVNRDRALHWNTKGPAIVWATSGQLVDLTSPWVCEYAQKTGQMHKLTKVDKAKPGERVVQLYNAPQDVRNAFENYTNGGPSPDLAKVAEAGLPSLTGAGSTTAEAEKAAAEKAEAEKAAAEKEAAETEAVASSDEASEEPKQDPATKATPKRKGAK